MVVVADRGAAVGAPVEWDHLPTGEVAFVAPSFGVDVDHGGASVSGQHGEVAGGAQGWSVGHEVAPVVACRGLHIGVT